MYSGLLLIDPNKDCHLIVSINNQAVRSQLFACVWWMIYELMLRAPNAPACSSSSRSLNAPVDKLGCFNVLDHAKGIQDDNPRTNIDLKHQKLSSSLFFGGGVEGGGRGVEWK